MKYNAEQEAFIAERVRVTKLEVLSRVVAAQPFYPGGPVPPLTLRDFSSLHEYCDANELGGLCADDVIAQGNTLFPERIDPDTISTQAFMHACNLIQDAVSSWMSTGRMAREADLVLRLLLEEQRDCLFDPLRNDEALGMLDDLQARVGPSHGFSADTCGVLRSLLRGSESGE